MASLLFVIDSKCVTQFYDIMKHKRREKNVRYLFIRNGRHDAYA